MTSPLDLMILLHYYASPRPYAEHEPAHANSSAVKECTDNFINEDMLYKDEDGQWRTTERANVFINYLTTIRYPTQTWVMK